MINAQQALINSIENRKLADRIALQECVMGVKRAMGAAIELGLTSCTVEPFEHPVFWDDLTTLGYVVSDSNAGRKICWEDAK